MKTTTDFWVGDRLVRPSLGKIQLGLERVHVEPRSMEVLLALARQPSQVIPKRELIEAVWGDAFVSDEVLTHAIWDLRRAFGDQASDPEFIQTIPKRGYRLIAPVKVVEEPPTPPESPAPPPRRGPRRTVLWGLLVIAALLGASLWLGRHEPAGESPGAAEARTAVVLAQLPSDGPGNWGALLHDRLGRGLAGPELAVLSGESCEAAVELGGDYCLESLLLHQGDGYRASARLLEIPSQAREFSVSAPVQGSGADLEAAAGELADKVHTYFQVVGDPDFVNPDLRPWISLQRHDIRAIRDFLLGVTYVYRNEIGGRHPLEAAIERDPGFVAPRIWRTPTLIQEEDAAAVAEHRRELERLYEGASAFEKAMLRWAMALIDEDPAEQIQQLRVALAKVEGNRQIQFVLGASLLAGGDVDEAWRLIQPLVKQGWRFPGLYPVAAQIALQRDRVDEFRVALDRALEAPAVDPEALAVMIALAIYDEDAGGERRYAKRLQLRRREVAPQSVETAQVASIAESLAVRADSEGRQRIAARLREFAG